MVLPSGCGGGSDGSSCPAGLCLNEIPDLEGKVFGCLYELLLSEFNSQLLCCL